MLHKEKSINSSILTGKECISCKIINGQLKTVGGQIASTQFFEAHQDYEIPIPGFIILSSNRHINSIDEFTAEEQIDFIKFLCQVRVCMRKALNVETVYLIQKEDSSSHFHVWLFPRYEWMKQFGKKISSLETIMDYANKNMVNDKNENEIKAMVEKLKISFNN